MPQHTLTIELDPAHQARRFYAEGIAEPLSTSGLPTRQALQDRLAPLLDALDSGDEQQLAQVLTRARQVEAGDTLFRVLLGDQSDWEPVLRQVWRTGSHPAHPLQHPLRIRIRELLPPGEGPLLDHVPWRITAYQGQTLSRSPAPWEFEVCPHEGIRRAPIHIRIPCALLIIAPERAAGELTTARRQHLAGLKEMAARAGFGDLLREARSRDEIRREVRFYPPTLVYYFGHGNTEGRQVGLLLDGDEEDDFTPLADLRAMLVRDGHHPSVVYLNGCKTAASGKSGPARQLLPHIPIVIAQTTTAWTESMTLQAERWFNGLFSRPNPTPVGLMHRVEPTEHESHQRFEWCLPTVATHAGEVTVNNTRAVGGRPDPSDHLDRTSQREAAGSEALKLIDSSPSAPWSTLRTTAVVGYGHPSDSLDLLGDQLLDSVRRQVAGRATVHPIKVPSGGETWRERLGVALDDDAPDVKLGRVLNAQVEHPPGLRRLVWLDFGVYGLPGGPDMLRPSELKRWWTLHCNDIALSCPNDLRVMSVMTLCPSKPDELTAALEELRDKRQYRNNRFRTRILEPLHYPQGWELRDSLQLTGCPPEIIDDLAAQMLSVAKTYHDLMKLMREGHHRGWQRLYIRLSDQGTHAPLDADHDDAPM